MAEFRTVRGMRDFLPDEARLLRYVEGTARQVAGLYGFKEIVTPVVEPYELLSAKAGEEIKSRMFKFKDLGERDIALRPEFTASVARLVATTFRTEPRPFRLFSVGSVYRYDEPQKGRYREFWQSNYELMGTAKPEADAEIILVTKSLMAKAGVKGFAFKVGHVGVLRGIFVQEKLSDRVQDSVMQLMDKKQYDDAFRVIEDAGVSDRCVSVLRGLVELKGKNVFEVVDRIKECVKDYEASSSAAENLGAILKLLKESGCEIDLTLEAGFARGLEYYTGMIFEVNVPDLDVALGGGGRYDRLIELYGGEPTPAVGVAHGLDRIMLVLQMQRASVVEAKEERNVVVIPVKEELNGEALRIAQMLRDADISVEVEVMGRKMTKALEDADRRRMDHAVIVGERELKEGAVVVRDLKTRQQSTVQIKRLVETLGD